MIKTKTERGFVLGEFQDSNGERCSIQESSSAMEPKIWLGINDPQPKIMASKIMEGGTGWANVPMHPDVLISGRMHLIIDQVKTLIPILQKFVETGEI